MPPETVYWFWVAVTSVAPAVAAPFHPAKNPGWWFSCLSISAGSRMYCAVLTGIGGSAAAFSGCTVSCLVGHFQGSYGNLACGFLAAHFYLVVEDGEFLTGVQLFDLVPAQGNVAERIAVEGDFAGDFVHEFAVQGVSVAEHEHVGLGVCGGLGRWIALSGAGDAGAEGSHKGR